MTSFADGSDISERNRNPIWPNRGRPLFHRIFFGACPRAYSEVVAATPQRKAS
ncbi:unnamed protein product [Tuwongella immobilis]|uniref:Uncharacterized protein n=1 Tax=Tuwongella immobilis TaxID=692036 RepID=A0A6C2YGI6_9BACT|nr:unnamed protein product [Tuwongella immobilis]VTR96634.1 unnamed protein product [Tuwongella immobilis]